MKFWLFSFFCFCGLMSVSASQQEAYVVSLEGAIDRSSVYRVRRAVKTAIKEAVPVVVLAINTPGGDLESTLELMEVLRRFEGHGKVLAFVEKEAMSAGCFIAAACDAVYMAPNSIVGAAAPIQSTGEDIPQTVGLKLMSFMRAKVRSLHMRGRYQEDVLRAMMDSAYVLEVESKVLKPEKELLSLTAEEATTAYGSPPEPLFAQGIAKNPEELLRQHFPEIDFNISPFKSLWAEQWAHWIKMATPVLMGLAMLLIFIELQTPSFGLLGFAGIALFGVVFLGEYVAGFAGYEGFILLLLGLGLVALELFLLPGTVFIGLLGVLLTLGALTWMLADVWPSGTGLAQTAFDWGIFKKPLIDITLSVGMAIVGALLLIRFLPRSWVWDRLVLKTEPESAQKHSVALPRPDRPSLPAVGTVVRACTPLAPSGYVLHETQRYEATCQSGFVAKDAFVRIIQHRDFGVLVEFEGGPPAARDASLDL